MPLPLTVSCFSKIQIGFTFLVPLSWVVPEKGPLNVCSNMLSVLRSVPFWRHCCVMYLRLCGWRYSCTYWARRRHDDTVAATGVTNTLAASYWLRLVYTYELELSGIYRWGCNMLGFWVICMFYYRVLPFNYINTYKHLITRTIVKRKAWIWGAGGRQVTAGQWILTTSKQMSS